MNKQNIDNKLKEYEALLGLDINDIQPADVEDVGGNIDVNALQQQIGNFTPPEAAPIPIIEQPTQFAQFPPEKPKVQGPPPQLKPTNPSPPVTNLNNQQNVKPLQADLQQNYQNHPKPGQIPPQNTQQQLKDAIILYPQRESAITSVMQSRFTQIPNVLNLDMKSFVECFQTLLRRHKQYQNFAKYLSENITDRQQEILKYSDLSRKCDIARNDLLSGSLSIDLSSFVNFELPVLKFEDIFQCTKLQYSSQIQSLVQQFNQQLQQQQLFLNMLKSNQQLQFKRGRKSEKLTQEFLKQQIYLTEQEVQYLLSLDHGEAKMAPIPLVSSEECSLEIPDNKDIPKNTLRLRFKRILLGPSSKYQISYTFSENRFKTNYNTQAGIFNYQEDHQIDPKQLSKQEIEVRVFQNTGYFRYSEVMVCSISLDKLEWTNTYEDYIPLACKNYPDCKIEFSLQIKEATLKTVNSTNFTIRHIQQQFAMFDLNYGINEYEGAHLPRAIMVYETKLERFKQKIEDQIQQQQQEILHSILLSTRVTQEKEALIKVEKDEVVLNQQKKQQVQNREASEGNKKTQLPVNTQIQPSVQTQVPAAQGTNQTQKASLPDHEPIQITPTQEGSELKIIIHGGQEDELVKQKQNQLPQLITLEEALNPDNPDKFPVSGFVMEYKKLLEKQAMMLRGPQRRQAQNILEQYMRKEVQLKRLADKGEFEKYAEMIRDLPAKERGLFKFYSEIGLDSWANVIKFRYELLTEEFKQLELGDIGRIEDFSSLKQLSKSAVRVKKSFVEPPAPQEQRISVQEINVILHGGEEEDRIRNAAQQIPADFNLEEVLQPENPKKAPVSGFIQEYKKLLEAKTLVLKGPQRRQVNSLFEDFLRQETILKKMADNGQFEEYVRMLENVLPREDKLIKFYKEIGLEDWAKVVAFRKQLLIDELQELQQQ